MVGRGDARPLNLFKKDMNHVAFIPEGNRFETVGAFACQLLPQLQTRYRGTRMTRKYGGMYTDNHRPRLYWTWKNMIRRCEDSRAPDYNRYGGRGISVCEEWHDLSAFLEWAYTHGWKENLTLDRIDNEGSYCPENCRWADYITQCNNRRSNIILEYDGKKMTVAQWSREIGIIPETLLQRLKRGWSVEDTLSKPLRYQRD